LIKDGVVKRYTSAVKAVSLMREMAIPYKLECGPMPKVVAALPNIGGTLCSMPQSAVQ